MEKIGNDGLGANAFSHLEKENDYGSKVLPPEEVRNLEGRENVNTGGSDFTAVGGTNINAGGSDSTAVGGTNINATRTNTSFLDSLEAVRVQKNGFEPNQSFVKEFKETKGLKNKAKLIPKKLANDGDRFTSGVGQILDSGLYSAQSKWNRFNQHKFKNTAKTLGKGAKFVAKTGVRAGLSAGGLAAGLAAGIATGDLDNAVQMGIAGAVAGNSAGKTANKYIAKGAGKVGQGINNTIVKPYQEGTMGTKAVKAQKEFNELNTEANRRYVAEETRRDDGSYLSQREIDNYMKNMFEVQQNGIYNVEEQLNTVKLQEATRDKYIELAQQEMQEEEKWIQNNVSEQEQAEIRAMTAEQMKALEASTRQEDVKKVETAKRIRKVDNKEEYYQKATQRAKDEAIMAASFRSQTSGMEDTERETYIAKRFVRNGYDERTARKATNQIMRNIDFLDGAKKNI